MYRHFAINIARDFKGARKEASEWGLMYSSTSLDIKGGSSRSNYTVTLNIIAKHN